MKNFLCYIVVGLFRNCFRFFFRRWLFENKIYKNQELNLNIKRDSNLIIEIEDNKGIITYKIQLDPQDNYYNNKFWITYTEQNCGNCIHYMIVCNENVLPQEVINLKNTGGNLTVRFAGSLKTICQKIFSPADYTYENITLTQIQTQ